MYIRPAVDGDLKTILNIYSHAREQMRLMGNPAQWGNDRPSPETVRADLAAGESFVVIEKDIVCGVFAFILGDDPTYRVIEDGAWPNDAPYGTIHRIASDGRTRGILRAALSYWKNTASRNAGEFMSRTGPHGSPGRKPCGDFLRSVKYSGSCKQSLSPVRTSR